MLFLAASDHRIPPRGGPVGSQADERRICQPFALRPWTGATIARPGYLPASHLLMRLPCRLRHPAPASAARSPEGNRTGGTGTGSITGSALAVLRRYGNINPLSIDYACRPRLRSRLTQGRLA